jgi:hypothetical protein
MRDSWSGAVDVAAQVFSWRHVDRRRFNANFDFCAEKKEVTPISRNNGS